jgi:hypothetical protein
MTAKIRIIAVGVIFLIAVGFGAKWFFDYQRGSHAQAAPPILSMSIDPATPVAAGQDLNLILSIAPQSTIFNLYTFTVSYDETQIVPKNLADLKANITNLKPQTDVAFTKATIDTLAHTVTVTGVGIADGIFLGSTKPIPLVKVTFTLKPDTEPTLTSPLKFIWTDPTTLNPGVTFSKKDLSYPSAEPTAVPTGTGPVNVPTATPTSVAHPTSAPIPCGSTSCPVGQQCVRGPINALCPLGVTCAAPTPYCTDGTTEPGGFIQCGNDTCTAGEECYQPTCTAPAGTASQCTVAQPYCRTKVVATPTPINAPVGSTTKISQAIERLYINSIVTYPAPFRYEQSVKLDKGDYTLSVGARVFVNKGSGMVIGVICNDDSCGSKTRNQIIYTTPRFPTLDYFSEMQQKVTIPSDGDQKNYLIRIFCEDGSECDIDYIHFEDAWGSDRLSNSDFTSSQTSSDPRKQPTGWTYDETANLYGSVDPAQGNNGALMINNPAE